MDDWGVSTGADSRRRIQRAVNQRMSRGLDNALEQIRAHGAALSPRQREVLAIMAAHPDDDEGELVYERGKAWLGDDRIAACTVFALLRACAISLESGKVGGVERYRINETGRELLKPEGDRT